MEGDALGTRAAGAELHPGLAGYAAYLLRRAYAFANHLTPHLGESVDGPCSPRDFQVLDALCEPGAAYSQQDLGDRLGINRTTMVKLIDRCEAAGQVTRTRNPGDRRSYVLALTEGGWAAVKAMGPAVSAADDRLTAALTANERDRLDALLAALLSRPTPCPGSAHRTGSLITQAHHFVRRRIEAVLAHSGMQAKHFGALTVLAGAACSQQQLARRLAISEQAVLQIVDDLEQAGRVARHRDPRDRRRYALRITESGQLALLTARRAVEDAEEDMSATLGADGRAELAALLTALLRADV